MSAERPGMRQAAGRIFRTSAFRLSAVYLLIFVFFAVFVLGYLAWNTRRLLDAQITETIETESTASPSNIASAGCAS
jgi:signal transduction histidine kinase (EC 2.7.3.-)